MQQQNHTLFKGNELAVINKDGTPSHNTSRDGLPRHVIDHLVTKKFIKQSLEAHVPLTPPKVIEQAEGLDQRAWENRFLKAFERILMGLVIA
jgi:hypothetical protein